MAEVGGGDGAGSVRAGGRAGRLRLRATWVAALAAALVAGLMVGVWLFADKVVPRGRAGPYDSGRLRPVIDVLLAFGVPLGALLVAAAMWLLVRRWLVVLVTAGVTAALLWAHEIWAQHLNHVDPSETSSAALRAGYGFAVPVTGLVVGFAVWVAVEPLGRLVPWRAGSRRVPAALGSVLAVLGLAWGLVRPWDRLPGYDDGGFLWLLVVGITLLVVVTGWIAARLTLRPVEAMRAELADITASSLDRRVPVPAFGGVLHQLARTLNATLDRLQSAADRQARFVADASHELRSPIASLRTSLESSLTHPEGVDWPHTVRGTLTDIERIQHLTDDLLLLTRIDGPAPNADESVQLADLASDLVEELRHLRRNSALQVVRTAPADLPPLTGSPLRMERLLRNLLENACRHARTEVEVVLSTDAARETVRVEVRDDGPGIPPADRERVFERFTRLDDSRTRADGGAGLGLAIAREIAVRQGGTLHVADGEGPGAVLVAEFPVVRGEHDHEEDVPGGEVPSGRSPRTVHWLVGALVALTVPLLAVTFVLSVRGSWPPDAVGPSAAPAPVEDAAPRAPVDPLRPVATLLWAGAASVNVHLYAPARTEAEAWAQAAAIRRDWPAALPGGAVRTPGAKPPFGVGNTVFVAGMRPENGSGVLAYGALPAAGRGGPRTAAVLVADPEGISGRQVELVLGWVPPTTGAVSYRWDDGTAKWPQLQTVLGSDRRWFITLGPPGAKSQGYDTYDLADRRTVGTR
ncbi:sensor histidine kinase [Streptomyces sp. NPDC004111]|uniref:sensor histidine kinase n=1 Tax=Streptomyces sp. NPDC004111 TaxID=3364690 RepID=UPI0036C1FDA0